MSEDIIMSDFNKLKKVCDELSSKKILVGIVGNVNSEVIKIAYVHEYGTGKMPERSFIRASFDTDKEKIDSIIKTSIDKILLKKVDAVSAMNATGAQLAQLIQNFIDTNKVKPKSNYKNKTQYTTLYETGTHIRDRIAYEIKEE